jgi:sulfatase maturation enzyme AslB (radical SAM superfamily)
MHCPRLDHFVKVDKPDKGKVIGLCCHMVDPPSFKNYETMINSEWLKDTKNIFDAGKFPKECIRCEEVEVLNSSIKSIRQHAIEEDKIQTKEDYLIANIMLDNICNSACQFCKPSLSTKIGSLISSNYVIHDNTKYFKELPLERIVQLDIAGGEPSNSKNVKNLLTNLPPNVQTIRFNTNCSSFMDELMKLVDKKIKLSITVSIDGVGKVHDYVRWPIKWNTFYKTLLEYKAFASTNTELVNVNLWSTVNTLNINDLENISEFAKDINLSHSFSFLNEPEQLNICYKNNLTLLAKEKFANSNSKLIKNIYSRIACDRNNQSEFDDYVKTQDKLRSIDIKDYIIDG